MVDFEALIEQAERDFESSASVRILGDDNIAKLRRLAAYAAMERKADEVRKLKERARNADVAR